MSDVLAPEAAPRAPHARDEPSRSPKRRNPRLVRARLRRAGAWALLLVPTAFFVTGDVLRRGSDLRALSTSYKMAYLGGVAEGLALWGSLLFAASRRHSPLADALAVAFVVGFGLIAGVQGGFFALWNVYTSVDAQLHSLSLGRSIVGHLPLDRPVVLGHFALSFALAVVLVRLGRAWLRPRLRSHWTVSACLPGLVLGATYLPTSYRRIAASPPDALYIHGLTAVYKELRGDTNDSPDHRVQLREPHRLPRLAASRTQRPNVVLVLQESQRADVTCVEYDPDCPLATPFTNAAAPNRYPLTQLRALDSTTAISISTIWSGMLPAEPFDVLHRAPLVWEYAKAAGYETGYFTTQHAMFMNIRLYLQDLPLDHFFSSTHIDRQSDPDVGASDSDLVDRVIERWPSLREPFFLVVHPSNVHHPYVYDPAHAPFQPASTNRSAEKNQEFFNYYKNVVYLSDIAMGRLVEFVRDSPQSDRTVMLYTSDHGEAFREHWQMGHTSSLYDEEVKVPGWIDSPPGLLSEREEASLRSARHDFAWHIDLLPTMLDLFGVWDDPGIASLRARMWGHPLTRPERTTAPLPMTNCSWVWDCAFRNWGMIQGRRKLSAREWDTEYHCYDLLDDPDEQVDLGERACAPLGTLARGWFGSMPKEAPPGRPDVDWGR